MKKVRAGQIRSLLGVKIVVLHTWGEDGFAIAPLSRKQWRPDQWKTSNGLVVHCGLVSTESTRWILDHSKLIGAISPRDLEACWCLFCNDLEDVHYKPVRITEEQIKRRLVKTWPPETPQLLAKSDKEWRNFMSVTEPLED